MRISDWSSDVCSSDLDAMDDAPADELGVTLKFEGQGVEEKGIVESVEGDKTPALKAGDVVVAVDPRYFRPAEVETLLGDPSKARRELGWTPEITAKEMCAEMVAADLLAAQRSEARGVGNEVVSKC